MEPHQIEEHVKSVVAKEFQKHAENAFPGGDVYGHKRAHDMLINDYRAKQKMKEDTLNKIITGIAWAIVVGVAYAVWAAVKSEVHR